MTRRGAPPPPRDEIARNDPSEDCSDEWGTEEQERKRETVVPHLPFGADAKHGANAANKASAYVPAVSWFVR